MDFPFVVLFCASFVTTLVTIPIARLLGIKVGLLINFGREKVEFKRIVY